MNRIRRGLLVLLASAAAAAACADAEEPACLAGARICFGSIVRLCDPVTQSFVDERVCPTTSRCMSGECVALVFDNDAGPRDAEVTLPDADPGADVATDAAPDADVLPDAIPDADVLPDAIPDAVFDADADAALDGAPDALPDADGGPEIQPDTTPDTDAEVAAPPDADGGPEIQPDTTPDADVEVEVTPDAVAVPDTVPDAAPDTAPDADAIIAPPVPFSPSTHHMQYDRVANIVLLDDLQRVAFHPAGGFAALVGTGGKLAHYAADAEAITPGAVLGGTVHDLAADPAGAYFLAVGVDKSGNGVLHRIATDGALLGDVTSTPLTQGEGVAVVASPDGARFAIGTSKKSGGLYLNTILIWRDGLGVVSSKSYTDSGLSDLMWASPALHAGSDAIITGDGTNGAASRTWILASDLLAGNGWSPGFGNPGGAGWRPGGGYGAFTGWSSNKLYVYDGKWTLATLPDTNTGASPNAIAWSPDGRRALIVGRASGNPLRAIVVEHRPLDTVAFNSAAFVEMSVPGFDASPWFGNSNVHLQDVAWRPASDCAEGLIVASDTGSTFSPNFGIAIRFRDSDDAACWP